MAGSERARKWEKMLGAELLSLLDLRLLFNGLPLDKRIGEDDVLLGVGRCGAIFSFSGGATGERVGELRGNGT